MNDNFVGCVVPELTFQHKKLYLSFDKFNF